MNKFLIACIITFLPSLASAATIGKLIDTQPVEFHSALDLVIIVTMSLVGALHAFLT